MKDKQSQKDTRVASNDGLERMLVEALAFYADIETYFAIGFFPDRPCGKFMTDFEKTDLGHKPGKCARKALRKYLKMRSPLRSAAGEPGVRDRCPSGTAHLP